MLKRIAASIVALSVVALPGTSQSRVVSGDPLFTRDIQWGLFQIHAPEAWSVTRGDGVVIAIVDSGVDLGHPDLRSKLITLNGADQVDPSGKNGPDDEFGHGTYVAGIAAASTDNDIGIAGTAPDARIMPVRVLDGNNSGTVPQIAAGITFAARHGADVINLSLGGTAVVDTATDKLDDSIVRAVDFAWRKGAVVVAAAGNGYFPYCTSPGELPHVICVGATNRSGDHSTYSNSDATLTKDFLVAPGGDNVNLGSCQSAFIVSTWARNYSGGDCSWDGGYEGHNGTSAATPFVSGAAALLVSQGLTNTQVVQRLIGTADDLGAPGRDPVFGFGRINVARAVGAN